MLLGGFRVSSLCGLAMAFLFGWQMHGTMQLGKRLLERRRRREMLPCQVVNTLVSELASKARSFPVEPGCGHG